MLAQLLAEFFKPKGNRCGNRKGFTLVEMLMALIILSVSILGLTSITLTSIRVNTQNDLRNSAIRLTNEKSEEMLSKNFLDIASGLDHVSVPIGGGEKNFDVTWTVTSPTANLRQIAITVQYDWRGQSSSNTAVIYRHRAM
jgi:prepilin-type N-terminal cleavage/methylation domain-containing protein